MGILSKVMTFFGSYPTVKASLQAGSLMCAGDIISQLAVEKRDKLDLKRTARFGLIGFGIGPILYKWYGLLETRIVFQNRYLGILGRVAADQLVLAPSFLYIFFWLTGGLQGLSAANIKETISETYPDVLIANYKLWPAVQLINFSVVPMAQRVLFVQSVALLWNTYLAFKTNQSPHAPAGDRNKIPYTSVAKAATSGVV